MTILGKLHCIEKTKIIYNIHYCRAGVGFVFYDPPEDISDLQTSTSKYPDNWKDYLTVDMYYPTFEEAVDAEYGRL